MPFDLLASNLDPPNCYFEENPLISDMKTVTELVMDRRTDGPTDG